MAQRPGHRTPVVPVNTDFGVAPLSLALLVAYASEHEGRRLADRYDFVPEFLTDEEHLAERANEPSIFVFSNYVWNVDRNLALSQLVKQANPASLTIHGGPSTPKYPGDVEEFFARHEHVDVAVHGEGEETFAELLSAVDATLPTQLAALHDVCGLTYRERGRRRRSYRGSGPDRRARHHPLPVPPRPARSLRRGPRGRHHRDEPRVPLRLHLLRLGFGDPLADPQVLDGARLRRARMVGGAPDRRRLHRGRELRDHGTRRRHRGEDRGPEAQVRLPADGGDQLRQEHRQAPPEDHRDLRRRGDPHRRRRVAPVDGRADTQDHPALEHQAREVQRAHDRVPERPAPARRRHHDGPSRIDTGVVPQRPPAVHEPRRPGPREPDAAPAQQPDERAGVPPRARHHREAGRARHGDVDATPGPSGKT